MEIISNFSPASKVWIYQATRDITTDEKAQITQLLTNFVGEWNSHGAPVQGAFEIEHDRFIVLIAEEESGVSGCSIDSSVKVIREIESAFQLGLLDRTAISYLNGNKVSCTTLPNLKAAIASGDIQKDSTIFNNSVATLEELETKWMQKAENSWIARYF